MGHAAIPEPAPNRRLGSHIFRPIVQFSLAALAALVMVLYFFVGQFDHLATQLQQDVVMRGYRNRFVEVADVVRSRLAWDVAARHLLHEDADWIDANLTDALYHGDGVTRLFVLGADDRLAYAARDGRRAGAASYAPFAPQIGDMLARLRAREAAYLSAHTPLQLTDLAQEQGQVMILVATRVQGDTTRAGAYDHRRMPVVVVAVPFDGRMIARFDGRYLVHALTIGAYGPAPAGHDFVVLADQRGRKLGLISWISRQPGVGLLRKLRVPLGLIVLVFGLLAWVILRQARNITNDLIASETHARHLAFHDALTQLPNRALMLERLAQLIAAARRADWRLAVHCLDLDRFKEVNDTLGHPAGDELIRAVAARLSALCRESDTVARLGGDEFVILQPYTTADGASHLAERVVAAFGEPFQLAAGVVAIGCSVGVSLLDGSPLDGSAIAPSEALRQADMALYGSKARGRGCTTFFETEMDVSLRMRRSLETDLRRAIADNQLTLVYQPQFDAGGRVMAMEALVRWDHPSRGAVPPTLFVSLAEDSGMIGELGEYILRRVMEETRDWGGIHVAINVSALQLRSPNFMAVVTRAVAEYGVDPNRYEFEITETVLLGDDDATRDTITVLKQEGFTIALDDFGTGFSSLSSLQRFAVDKIKIDRAFVRNLEEDDPDARTLVEAIVKLGAALNLGVIAEGVETPRQRAVLIACGCPLFQGYLLGMPEPAAAIAERYLAPRGSLRKHGGPGRT